VKTSPKSQQKLVDDWNAKHPGTDVDVIWHKLINPNQEPIRSQTRSPAWLMGGHTAMIMVSGQAGGVALESVVIVPKRNIE
jgi:hypothetical protein